MAAGREEKGGKKPLEVRWIGRTDRRRTRRRRRERTGATDYTSEGWKRETTENNGGKREDGTT